MAVEVDARLAKLGIDVPVAAAPVVNYVGFVQTGNLVFVSGQVPIKEGKFLYQGKLGAGMSLEDAQAAARLCAINIVAQVKAACGGDLDRVQRVVKLTGFVNSTGDFRSEEHTSELQSLMRNSYAVFCLKKKNNYNKK